MDIILSQSKNLNSFEGKELLFRPDDIDIVEKQNCHFSGIVKASFFTWRKDSLDSKS